MDTAPRPAQTVYLVATVTEVHHADMTGPYEYRTVMIRLADGQQVMTHWSNVHSAIDLFGDRAPEQRAPLEAAPPTTTEPPTPPIEPTAADAPQTAQTAQTAQPDAPQATAADPAATTDAASNGAILAPLDAQPTPPSPSAPA